MKFKTWLIKGNLVLFPEEWTKEYILEFANSEKICPICEEKDIHPHHFRDKHLKRNEAI